jgi:hypothetical protein
VTDPSAPIRPTFNGSLRIEGRPERLTSESGAVILRETVDRMGIIDWLAENLVDPRKPHLVTHPMTELLRTRLFLMAMGWRDGDDADALRHDAALRLSVSDRRGDLPLQRRTPREDGQPLSRNPEAPDGLASQPTQSRLLSILSQDHNRGVLRSALLETAARRVRAMHRGQRLQHMTLDLDSLPVEVHGRQPGSEYNGHYHAQVYHPLMATMAETGDVLDAMLRPGAVHTAEGGVDFLLPLLDNVERNLCHVASVRMDAGFPCEEMLGPLEKRGTFYVARVKNNAVLDKMAAPHLKRPVGRPPAEPRMWFHENLYRAGSWSRERRVVLVTQERPGELFHHHFWLITNWPKESFDGPALLELYRDRGTAEGRMGELMDVLEPALSSSTRPKSTYRGRPPKTRTPSVNAFKHNEVLLLLNALAYNILHAARVLLGKATQESWSVRRLRERVLSVAGRVLTHARQVTLVVATAAAELWQALWPSLSGFHFEVPPD